MKLLCGLQKEKEKEKKKDTNIWNYLVVCKKEILKKDPNLWNYLVVCKKKNTKKENTNIIMKLPIWNYLAQSENKTSWIHTKDIYIVQKIYIEREREKFTLLPIQQLFMYYGKQKFFTSNNQFHKYKITNSACMCTHSPVIADIRVGSQLKKQFDRKVPAICCSIVHWCVSRCVLATGRCPNIQQVWHHTRWTIHGCMHERCATHTICGAEDAS